MKLLTKSMLAMVFAVVSSSAFAGMMYQAELLGSNEVPPVMTQATGLASFELNMAGDELDFQIELFNIDSVTAGHIHLGAAGVNGPIVAIVLPSMAPSGPINGLFISGTILEIDLVTGSFMELVNGLNSGNLYVNIHTVDHPPGEVRGQIEAVSTSVNEPMTLGTVALGLLGLAGIRRRLR